ncbi:MAG: FAD-dependent oxidoreductase [Rhodospirillales bacterium]|nr:FAD-dependent oxidoreductase [Rhodospirillales bacterium]
MLVMTQQRILILGAGFGGVYTARALARHVPREVCIEIVDNDNYFVFQPLLPEVAAGSIDAADAVTSLRLLLPKAKVSEAEVVSIDFHHREVEVIQDMRRHLRRIPYDHLVVALGQRVDLSRYPGLAEHGLTMKDLADAFRLRNHLIDCLEQADATEDAEDKRRMLTFVVIGGGLSGVETVGEMENMLYRCLRFYPRIRRDEIRILLVEYQPRLLAELPDSLAGYVARELRRRRIEVITGTGIKGASATDVELSDGRVIRTMTIVATVGNAPSALVDGLPFAKYRGRIVTDRFLRVPGIENVWAIGDVAAIPLENEQWAPPTAQAARQEADVLAHNLVATARGRPLRQAICKSRGQLASIGGRRGVANLFGREMAGFFAWVLWRSIYLAMVPGWSTKARVAMDWMLDAVLPRNVVQIQQPGPSSVRRQRFRQGDIVFQAGDVTGPFHLVLSGVFERIDSNGQTTLIPAGGHFGEGALAGEKVRRASVRAREESYCLVIERDDFERLASCWKGLAPFVVNAGPTHRAVG